MPPPSVLIVDDEPSLLTTLAIILDSNGYQSTTCDTVATAEGMIGERRFDLLLADLSMPGDGRTVLATMRRARPETAIIVITGHIGPADIPPEVRALADAVLFKPTEIPLLLETMRRLVGAGEKR